VLPITSSSRSPFTNANLEQLRGREPAMNTIKPMFWAAPLTTKLTKKANIDPAVRARLEELGVDTVRSKLVWIMNVKDLAQQDELQPLGVGLSASRRQMQDWLTEKAARETLWVRVGVIAAVLAALFSLLSWYAPLIKISINQVSSGQ
jgi:hypothetical protein